MVVSWLSRAPRELRASPRSLADPYRPPGARRRPIARCARRPQAIREWIAKEVDQATADEIRIQYGGSANAKNAPELSACPDIDGFLVGGASLKPEFADIVKAIAAAKT